MHLLSPPPQLLSTKKESDESELQSGASGTRRTDGKLCQRDHVSRHLINLCTALDDVQVQQPVLLDQPSLCINVAEVPSHGAATRELCSLTTNHHISNVSNCSDELSASATGGACITLHLNSAGRLKKADMDVCKAVIVAPARVAAAQP